MEFLVALLLVGLIGLLLRRPRRDPLIGELQAQLIVLERRIRALELTLQALAPPLLRERGERGERGELREREADPRVAASQPMAPQPGRPPAESPDANTLQKPGVRPAPVTPVTPVNPV